MSITTVHGNAVDCHICRRTTHLPDNAQAHAYAQDHAAGHQAVHIPVRHPSYAKTTINHTPHIILDVISLGMWIPFHIMIALLGGRKTRIS